MGYTFVTQFR